MANEKDIVKKLKEAGFNVNRVRASRTRKGYFEVTRDVNRSTETLGIIEGDNVIVIYGSGLISDNPNTALRFLGQVEGALNLRKKLDSLSIPYIEQTPMYENSIVTRAGLPGHEDVFTATDLRRDISRDELARCVAKAGTAYLEGLVNSIK